MATKGGDELKRMMLDNAEKINRIMVRIKETVRSRDNGPSQEKAWRDACRDLHEKYDDLAFPYDLRTVEAGLVAGDTNIVDAVLCFLEIRPYYFRSGYFFSWFLRRMKRAKLTKESRARYEAVLARQREWELLKMRRKDDKEGT